jgi:hypothetical protein
MESEMGVNGLIGSAGQHAEPGKATACCGASENVVANRGFRVHSEFNF